MFIKILAFLAIIVVIYMVFFKNRKKGDSEKKGGSKEDLMVECKKCGTYVSSHEAFIKDGSFFCSEECMNTKDKK